MDWKKTLGALAPALGTAFGPIGAAGGIAIKQLLGLPGATDDAVATYIQTPEGVQKLKQAEYDYKLGLKKIALESDALDIDNTKDARKRDAEIQKTNGDNKRADNLAYMAVIAFLLCVFGILFVSIPEGTTRDLAMLLMGVLAGIVKDIYGFEFGSSRGSKDKDKINVI